MISSPSRRLLILLLAVMLAGAGGTSQVFADAAGDFHAASRAVDAKEYDKAVRLYTRVLDSGELTEKQQFVTYAGRAYAHYFARQYGQSLADFDEAIRRAPEFAEYYAGRGAVYFDTGRYREALEDYEEAVRLKPGFTKAVAARDALRKMLADQGGEPDAGAGANTKAKGAATPRPPPAPAARAGHSRSSPRPDEGAAVTPADAFWQGSSHLSAGRFDEAIVAFDRVVGLDPRFAPAYAARSDAYNGKGQWDRAIEDAEAAFALDPGNIDAHRNMAIALNGKAWRFATSPDPVKRDGRRAVDLAERATRLQPDEPYIRGTLAAAYAAAGRFDDAVSAQRLAIQMLIADGRRREAAFFVSRLESYLQKKPHRQ